MQWKLDKISIKFPVISFPCNFTEPKKEGCVNGSSGF